MQGSVTTISLYIGLYSLNEGTTGATLVDLWSVIMKIMTHVSIVMIIQVRPSVSILSYSRPSRTLNLCIYWGSSHQCHLEEGWCDHISSY